MPYDENLDPMLRDYEREDILNSLYPILAPVTTSPAFMVKNYETGLEDIEVIYYVESDDKLFPVTRHLCEYYSIEPIDLVRSVNDRSYDIYMNHISKPRGIPEEILDIYALTNSNSYLGAGLLITDSGRQSICDVFQHSAVYIFPVSDDEVILVSAQYLETESRLPRFKEYLKDLASALADTDHVRLSDHVYRFNPEGMTFRTVI